MFGHKPCDMASQCALRKKKKMQRQHSSCTLVKSSTADLPSCAVKVDLVGLLQTELSQSTAELQGQLLVFDKALVAVAAHLKVGPLLVDLLLDTINDLLDLLVLDMGLDQVTSSDGLRIAVNTRGAAEDIVGGSDILSRAKDEAILGGGQSTRNGLALNRLVSRSLYGKRRLLVHARLDAKLLELLLGHRHLGGTRVLDGGNGKTGSVGGLGLSNKVWGEVVSRCWRI